MVEAKQKMVAPSAKELSDAIAAVLSYPGPVDVGIVTRMIQKEHPTWKLPERRVNKFVKRHQSKHKNPVGADDDETAVVYKKNSSRNLLRFFSPKSKNALVTEEAVVVPEEEHQEAAPNSPKAPPTPANDADEIEPATSTEPEPEEEADETTLTEVPSKDVAYDTDDNIVSSKELCHCDACNIM